MRFASSRFAVSTVVKGYYQNAVVELDKKEHINIRLSLIEIRNNYAILYDLIMKNFEKIKNPRSSDHMDRLF